jgi:hypothetical protein
MSFVRSTVAVVEKIVIMVGLSSRAARYNRVLHMIEENVAELGTFRWA